VAVEPAGTARGVNRHVRSRAVAGYTAPMKLRIPVLLSAIVLSLALPACGNKGPLVLPDRDADGEEAVPVGPADGAVTDDGDGAADGAPDSAWH
jgi:predicted small lipoprotein YifL